ncbi:MAG: alpha-L-rhamnosidase N-terminal domain-containing protein [Clostridiales bacterium]|nr:alpha-L-rhamnosidase N-terminal domain-containing protein [Clostridiales bacterium]
MNGEFTHRIYYRRYDITSFVGKGKNCVGLILGNGWYRQTRRVAEGEMKYGDCLKCAFAVCADGAVVTADGAKCSPGYISENNVYYGECQDSALFNQEWAYPGFDDSEWQTVAADKDRPQAGFVEQNCPCDKIIMLISTGGRFKKLADILISYSPSSSSLSFHTF